MILLDYLLFVFVLVCYVYGICVGIILYIYGIYLLIGFDLNWIAAKKGNGMCHVLCIMCFVFTFTCFACFVIKK